MSTTATAARSSGRLRRSSSSPRRQRPRTAFVLSGGASLGALQVGMLRALYERGVVPDLLVGTSAGAINAAFVASRPQKPSTADELARIWRRLERQDVFPVSARALIGGAMGHRDHLFPDHGLRQLVRRHVDIELLEESRVPLHLVAFDLTSGEEMRLSRGPALDAVMAATAVPGLLPPVSWGGALPVPPRGALDAAVHGLTLLVGARLEADLARYADDVELVVLPAANPNHVQPTDFDHSSGLIGEGLVAARAALRTAATPRSVAA